MLKKIGKFVLVIIFLLGDYLESIIEVIEDCMILGNFRKVFERKKEEFVI